MLNLLCQIVAVHASILIVLLANDSLPDFFPVLLIILPQLLLHLLDLEVRYKLHMLDLHLGTRERQVFQILYELERDKASSQIRNYAVF